MQDENQTILNTLQQLRNENKEDTKYKNLKHKNIYLKPENAKKLKSICDSDGRKSSDIYNEVIALYFEYYKIKNNNAEEIENLLRELPPK